MRSIPLCVVLGGWLSMPALAADADAWLHKLAGAEGAQSYHGIFLYERNGSFSSHAVWRLVDGQGQHERLLQLDGPAAQVVRVDGKVRCASEPLAAEVSASQPWRQGRLDPAVLSQWYDFRLLGDSRVAGRSAVALALQPRDQHRYGFELHLDRETGLPLKSLLINENRQLLERFQFVQFSPAGITLDDVAASEDCRPVELAKLVHETGNHAIAWHSDWLPDGFQLIDAGMRPSPASPEDSVSWLSYGDGLARFSVFLEALDGTVVEDARSQIGPTVAVSRRISTGEGDVMVTVVGEVPPGTAERVALSMRAGSDQASR